MAGLLRMTSCLAMAKNLRHLSKPHTILTNPCRAISFNRKKSESSAITSLKTDYEIELERLSKVENYQENYGFHHNPYLDKFDMHMLFFLYLSLGFIFLPFVLWYGSELRTERTWTRCEASLLIEEREARGEEVLIDPNFVPADLIESMVPPPGDWEEEWLRSQPAVESKPVGPYSFQTPTR